MNFKKNILIVSVIITLFSCAKKPSIRSETNLYNFTEHKITIWIYNQGNISNILTIAPNQTFQFGLNYSLGEINFDYYGDSLLVLFDDKYKITHYGYATPISLRKQHYLIKSKRNILNGECYDRRIVGERKFPKCYGEYYYSYYFTVQDYLDAQP